MKGLPTPKVAATSLVSDKLKNSMIQKMFLGKKREGQISLLLVHLIGPETERYAASPVYAKRGKGSLQSKGVDGLRDEIRLEEYLRSNKGRAYVDQVLELVEEEITAGSAR